MNTELKLKHFECKCGLCVRTYTVLTQEVLKDLEKRCDNCKTKLTKEIK